MQQKVIEIHSDNAAFQVLESVKHNRNKRHRQGYFLIEGVKAINLALESGWPVHGAVVERGKALSNWAADVLKKAPAVYRLAPSLMERLSDKEDTSELILLGGMRKRDISGLPKNSGLYMLLDRPMSPGNLGSVIRSADAFSADALLVCGHSADIYDPQTIRASIGTLFTLPVFLLDGPDGLDVLKQEIPGICFIGTSAKAEKTLNDVDMRGPVLLLMGNETHGLSKALKEKCDVLVKIPIGGAVSSLNLASAASICLYEAKSQRNKGEN